MRALYLMNGSAMSAYLIAILGERNGTVALVLSSTLSKERIQSLSTFRKRFVIILRM